MNFQTIRSVLAILLGISAIMLGVSYQSAILGVRGAIPFNDVQLGIITSVNFVGFLLGSMFIPRQVNNVGHVRCFAAMTAIFSCTVLLFPLRLETWSWSILQFVSGFAVAGLFIIAESWLNDASDNNNRGQLLALYVIVVMAGKIMGYNVINLADINSYIHFTLMSVVVSLASVPMLLSAGASPVLNPPEVLKLTRLFKISPAGMTAVLMNAMVVGMVNGYGPVYGARINLSNFEIGMFLSVIMLGSMVAQMPLGRLSDKIDRRIVIVGVTCVSVITSLLLMQWPTGGWDFWVLVFLFGAASFSIYPVACAHTNDFLTPSQRVAACGGVMITASIGMAMGPLMGGILVDFFGGEAFFGVAAFCGILLIGFVGVRIRFRQAPASEQSGDFVPFHPRTSIAVAEMAAQAEEEGNEEKGMDEFETEATDPSEEQIL